MLLRKHCSSTVCVSVCSCRVQHCWHHEPNAITVKSTCHKERYDSSANLSSRSSANSTFLQHVSSINTIGCYKSLLVTLFFCFRTVNLELFTSTYSLYRQTLNVQASTKVTLLPVCFHCLVTLCQRLRFISTILALYKFACMSVCMYVPYVSCGDGKSSVYYCRHGIMSLSNGKSGLLFF